MIVSCYLYKYVDMWGIIYIKWQINTGNMFLDATD